jgi:drug/metabolite transporter (DMT)-like permease
VGADETTIGTDAHRTRLEPSRPSSRRASTSTIVPFALEPRRIVLSTSAGPTAVPAVRSAPRAAPWLVWSALLVLYLVWGSTYLFIRIGVESIPPMLLGGVRFVIAGAVLLGWARLRGELGPTARPTRAEVRNAVVVGFLLLTVANGLVVFAEQTIPSGIAALLVATMPLWVAMFSLVVLRRRVSRPVLLGLALGFAGVVVLVWRPVDQALDPIGVAALVIGPISWAAGSLFAQQRRLPAAALVATGIEMLAAGIVLLGAALLSGEPGRLAAHPVTLESLLSLGYLIVAGSLLAFTAYAWLLTVAPLSLIATYAYVNPVVAVVLGTLVLSEPFTPQTAVGAATIVVAVAIIVALREREPREVGPIEAGAVPDPKTATRRSDAG